MVVEAKQRAWTVGAQGWKRPKPKGRWRGFLQGCLIRGYWSSHAKLVAGDVLR